MNENPDNETTDHLDEEKTGKKKTGKKKSSKKKTGKRTTDKKTTDKKISKKKTDKKTSEKKTKALKTRKPRRTPQEIAEAEAAVGAIADAVHAIIKEAAPGLSPTSRWGHDWYAGTDLVVGVALHGDHVNLVVYNGEQVNDPENLMMGVGYNRSVRINRLEDIRKSPLMEIVRSAASADAAKQSQPTGQLKSV
ncbi:MAG: hypothetical protein A2289_16250 [Deltaproteobacteria bacterium RIFOXYA12_FULL_58_15]|nr:MAG: hypothetical protein A2289_16250 [Deltaproteobacteria bacterium RIFOXYA12_FULL_58_15]OGR09954.1 MAG: hypothetical protein A2341_12335 [Deltaproteobacteria bacterium RIFOXYB12_FULL_58_9]